MPEAMENYNSITLITTVGVREEDTGAESCTSDFQK
jgi:hypothetical protein